MRIISGRHKGKRIHAPKQLSARPTTDMAKEALFNILNNHFYIDQCSVLDLYAGTGNISYEFASRGAPQITAVELDSRAVSFISKTSKNLDFPIEVFKSDVFSYLRKTPRHFDIIFADPPYDMASEDFAKIPAIVFERELLAEGGVLVVEHSKHLDMSTLDHFDEARRYGGSVFSFFRK